MKRRRVGLATKTAGIILAVFVPGMLVLSAVQYALQSATFRTILGDFQESTLNVKRDAAQAILQEVKIATEDSLQRGEHTKFVHFAKQQAQLEEIEAFSFYDAQGKVALSSDQDRIGKPLDPKLWAQAQESRTVFTTETADAMALYCPLRADADMLRLDPTRALDQVYGVLSLEFSKDKINHMLAEAQDARAAGMRKVLGIVILSMAAITAIMVAAAVLIARGIARPIVQAAVFAKAIAAKDLTATCSVKASAEVGDLIAAMNEMNGNLHSVINDVTHNAEALAGSSTHLSATATQMVGNAEQMSAKASAVTTAAEQMAKNMGDIAAATEQMSTGINTVAASVEETTASIGEVARNAEQAATIAHRANQLAEDSNANIGQLGTAANEIGKVIETIQDIAEQTNLLALNATIEAARAGGAGKGFAVVADEVKELARQTAEATEDIRTRIQGIQTSTGETVGAISEIRDVIRQVNEVSRTIASAVEEQSITMKDIASNVAQTATAAEAASVSVAQSAAASQEITSSIATVNQAAQESAQGAVETRTAGGSLADLSEKLQSLVRQFSI